MLYLALVVLVRYTPEIQLWGRAQQCGRGCLRRSGPRGNAPQRRPASPMAARRARSPAWTAVEALASQGDGGGRAGTARNVRCLICGPRFSGGASRIEHHLRTRRCEKLEAARARGAVSPGDDAITRRAPSAGAVAAVAAPRSAPASSSLSGVHLAPAMRRRTWPS